ncbi:hypothetical protein CHLRE_09g389503v5 [Chlamydomonas reinhardtii]|uniref:Uncharacterized protein n=1 Tax=Chlamydomonas reinhardtii TaxID=3055 RepID=A0A2K3DDM2_CHLRE|nr:uncharacterized protein CHLRE_09g389503v5 [Chlamydomonas reinhardtii]PNW78624.1 hypothetical protein CHLRE_09g389503v5 [Chlamydomonas reinhardtii]
MPGRGRQARTTHRRARCAQVVPTASARSSTQGCWQYLHTHTPQRFKFLHLPLVPFL